MAITLKGSSTTYSRSNHSFSGVDIKAVFGGVPIGTLQALSYAITREKAPIYTMGDPDPRSFSRGKRAIAGSMVFILFDRDPLLYYMKDLKVSVDKDAVRWDISQIEAGKTIEESVSKPNILGGAFTSSQINANPTLGFEVFADNSDQVVMSPWYSDQVPPFDINIYAANEYGAKAKMAILHVELTDEGHGMSVDDVQLGKQMKWIGRYVMPWTFDGLVDNSYLAKAKAAADQSVG